MVNTYQQSIKDDIITLLTDGPLTIQQLVSKLNLPYASVQQAHKSLREEGKIIKFDKRDRGARYTLGANNGPKSIIPYVRFEGQDFKYTDLTDYEGLQTICAEAARDVMKAWTTIAITAQRLASGVPNETLTKRLNAQKHQLGQARNRLENVVFLINQMLESPKLWDTSFLLQFVDDKDWGTFLPKLDKMYANFYGANNASE
jgi:hypothetical protein